MDVFHDLADDFQGIDLLEDGINLHKTDTLSLWERYVDMSFDLTEQFRTSFAIICNLRLKGNFLPIFFDALMDVLLSDISVDLFDVLLQLESTSAKKL